MSYIRGDGWAICDMCGFQKRWSQTKMQFWNGMRVCKEEYNDRPIEDYMPYPTFPNEEKTMPNSRPEPATDTFVEDV